MRPATTPPSLLTLVFLTGLSTLSLNMTLPSLPAIARALDADYALVSLAVGGYLGVTAVLQLVLGPLSDRVGRRPVLLGALTVFAVASVGCALAEDVWTFLAFRALQAGMIAGYAISLAVVRDTTPEREAAGRIGTIASSMALAPMLGPMLGGALDAAFGWRTGFWVYAGAAVMLWALVWCDLGETRVASPTRTGGQRAALLREPAFWAHALCVALSTAAFYLFLAGTPLVAEAAFGYGTATVGIYLGSITGGFLVGSLAAARFAPRMQLSSMMLIGRVVACGGLATGMALMAVFEPTPLGLFGATIFVGLGNGISLPSAHAGVMSVRPWMTGTAAGLSGALTVGSGALVTTLAAPLFAIGVEAGPRAAALTLLGLMLAASAGGLFAAVWAARLRSGRASD